MYHGVTPDIDGKPAIGDHKHVGESRFREHLRLLAELRRVLPLSTLIDILLEGRDCQGMVAITFDDGYLNNAECAAPALQEFSMSATFFLATGFVGLQRWAWTDLLEFVVSAAEEQEVPIRLDGTSNGSHRRASRVRVGPRRERGELLQRLKAEFKDLDWRLAEERVAELAEALGVGHSGPHGQYRFMTWDHARALVKAGFEVGAHTVNHAILSRVSISSAEQEILGSKEQIENEIGTCCPTFCYPNGKVEDFNEHVVDICRRHFHAALSAIVGTARAENRFQIHRIGAGHETSAERLAERILRGE